MWQFTHTHHPRNMPVVGLCVLIFHAVVLRALLMSAPQVNNNHASIAMEMVLAPLPNSAQPTSHAKPSTSTMSPVIPKSIAAPAQATPQVTTTAPLVLPPSTAPSLAFASSNNATSATPSPTAGLAQSPPALSLPNAEAQGLNNPKPLYPKLSRRLNEQGQVVVRVYVGADGKAQQGEIKTSSGYDRLDQEALRTVLRWHYVPGQRLGVSEAMWFNVPVNFVLE